MLKHETTSIRTFPWVIGPGGDVTCSQQLTTLSLRSRYEFGRSGAPCVQLPDDMHRRGQPAAGLRRSARPHSRWRSGAWSFPGCPACLAHGAVTCAFRFF